MLFLSIPHLASFNIHPNPNIGMNGSIHYCSYCERSTIHDGYSHKGKPDQFLVCRSCKLSYIKDVKLL